MSLILRKDKGSKLSITELDGNFEYLNSKYNGDITFTGTTMSSKILDNDITIQTKGEGGVVIQNDKPNSWVLNIGLKFNDQHNIWGSSVTTDDEGNSYTTGGDYIVNSQGFIIKTNKIGEIVWQKHIKEFALGESIVYKNGHLYVFLTETNTSGILIVKLDTDGNSIEQWSFENSYIEPDGGSNVYGYEIDIDENENVYWVGRLYKYDGSGYDIVVGKLNTINNVIEWSNLLDTGYSEDYGYSIKYKNNFLYVTGYGQGSIPITKLDTNGNQIWTKKIDDNQGQSYGYSITIDNLDNVYVCGSKSVDDDNIENFYLKLNSLGEIIWSKKLINTSYSIQINQLSSIDFNDGFLYLTQTFNNDIFIAKIDTDGNIIWQNKVGTNNIENQWFDTAGHRSIKATKDSLYVIGYNYNNIVPNNDRYDSDQINMFLIKYDTNGLTPNTFQDWTIATSSITQNDYIFASYSNITLSIATFSQLFTKTSFEFVDVKLYQNNEYKYGFDTHLTNFSNKKTQLKVKGEINVNDLYVLPESTGKNGEVLTYPKTGNLLEWDKPGTTLAVDDFVKSSWDSPQYTTDFGDTTGIKQIVGQKEVNILTIYNYYLGGAIIIKRRDYSNTELEWEFSDFDLQNNLQYYWSDASLSVELIYSDLYDKKFKISSYESNTNGNSVVTVEVISGGLTASIETTQGYHVDSGFSNEFVDIDFKDYPYYPNTGAVIDESFIINSGFNNMVFNIEIQSDGKSIVAGNFSSYDGNPTGGIARLNIDGSLDKSFDSKLGFNNNVKALKIQSDGKILVGGAFTIYGGSKKYNGTSANHIIRLNSDGSVDSSFLYGTGFNQIVRTIEIQSNGKILVGGDFTTYNGTSANGIIRLNSDGSVDGSFVYGTGFSYSNNGNVFVIKVLSTGNILVGGWFDGYDGSVTNCLVELNSTGSVTNTFSVSDRVSTIVEQPDGKILLGGFFTNYEYLFNGYNANHLVRLNSDFSIDTRFNDGNYVDMFNGSVQVIKLQSDGKILCGGQFTQYYDPIYGSRDCQQLARLNSNGTFDTTFDIGGGFTGNGVNAIAVQSDNKILVGGFFTDYFGQQYNVNRIVRLYSGLEVEYLQPEFMGVKYDKVSVSSNSYLTFGGGSALNYTNTLNLPGIFISSGTNNTSYTRRYNQVYAGFYKNSNDEIIFKIRYYEDYNYGFGWEVCFIINQGNVIDIKIGENFFYAEEDYGFTGIKDINFIRKEFTPIYSSNYYLPEAWGARDVKSDSIKLNNPGITYSINEGLTEVNLPVSDSDWNVIPPSQGAQEELKIRTYNGSKYLTVDGQSRYVWFEFDKTPYEGNNLKGGIIEFHLHDSQNAVTIGTITFNRFENTLISNVIGGCKTNLSYDINNLGIRFDSAKDGFTGSIWVHWTSRLFYGSYVPA